MLNLPSYSANFVECLTASFVKNTSESAFPASDFISLTKGLECNDNFNLLRTAVLNQAVLPRIDALPPILLVVENWNAFFANPDFAFEWLNIMVCPSFSCRLE